MLSPPRKVTQAKTQRGEASDEPISLTSKDPLKGARRNGKLGGTGDARDCNIAQRIDEQPINHLGSAHRTAIPADVGAVHHRIPAGRQFRDEAVLSATG